MGIICNKYSNKQKEQISLIDLSIHNVIYSQNLIINKTIDPRFKTLNTPIRQEKCKTDMSKYEKK